MSLRLLPMCLTMALVLNVCSPTDSRARTIHVNTAGGADATNIKLGLAMAVAGDTVLVAAGTYNGADNRGIIFGGKKVLMSESGAAATIIDGEDQDGILILQQAVDSTAVIRGFTFTRGRSYFGGAIHVTGASPKIVDCIFKDNTAITNGGAIALDICSEPVIISGCVFEGNTATYRAGGLMAAHSPARVTGCVFRENSVTNSELTNYYGGGGLSAFVSTVQVSGCTFVGNSAVAGPGGIHGYATTITVENSIVAFSTQGKGIAGATASGCVVFGNAGGDDLGTEGTNILYADPLFCGAANGDLTLCANSPCLPGATVNPAAGQLVGVHGQGCTSCAAPVTGTTWGAIKALCR